MFFNLFFVFYSNFYQVYVFNIKTLFYYNNTLEKKFVLIYTIKYWYTYIMHELLKFADAYGL